MTPENEIERTKRQRIEQVSSSSSVSGGGRKKQPKAPRRKKQPQSKGECSVHRHEKLASVVKFINVVCRVGVGQFNAIIW